MRPPLAILPLLAALAACGDRAPAVASCDDALAGVWKTRDGRGYHVVENRTGIEIFAMFDTTVPPGGDKNASPLILAPVAFDLRRQRRPGHVGLHGRRTQRMTREGRICTVRTEAVIDRCENDTMVLRFERPGELDWTRCRHAPTGEWETLSLQHH